MGDLKQILEMMMKIDPSYQYEVSPEGDGGKDKSSGNADSERKFDIPNNHPSSVNVIPQGVSDDDMNAIFGNVETPSDSSWYSRRTQIQVPDELKYDIKDKDAQQKKDKQNLFYYRQFLEHVLMEKKMISKPLTEKYVPEEDFDNLKLFIDALFNTNSNFTKQILSLTTSTGQGDKASKFLTASLDDDTLFGTVCKICNILSFKGLDKNLRNNVQLNEAVDNSNIVRKFIDFGLSSDLYKEIRAYIYFLNHVKEGSYSYTLRKILFGSELFDAKKCMWDDPFAYYKQYLDLGDIPDGFKTLSQNLPSVKDKQGNIKNTQYSFYGASDEWTKQINTVFDDIFGYSNNSDILQSIYNDLKKNNYISLPIQDKNKTNIQTAYDRLEFLFYERIIKDKFEDTLFTDTTEGKDTFKNIAEALEIKHFFSGLNIPWNFLTEEQPISVLINYYTQNPKHQESLKPYNEFLLLKDKFSIKNNQIENLTIRDFFYQYKSDRGDSKTEDLINNEIESFLKPKNFILKNGTPLKWERRMNEGKYNKSNEQLSELLDDKSIDGGIQSLKIAMEYQGEYHLRPNQYSIQQWHNENHIEQANTLFSNEQTISRSDVWLNRLSKWLEIYKEGKPEASDEKIMEKINFLLDEEFLTFEENDLLVKKYYEEMLKCSEKADISFNSEYFLINALQYTKKIKTNEKFLEVNTMVLCSKVNTLLNRKEPLPSKNNILVDKYGIPINLDLSWTKSKYSDLMRRYNCFRNDNMSCTPHNCKRRWMVEANCLIVRLINDFEKKDLLLNDPNGPWTLYCLLPPSQFNGDYSDDSFNMLEMLDKVFKQAKQFQQGEKSTESLFESVVKNINIDTNFKRYVWPNDKEIFFEDLVSTIKNKI